jgi:hypothetical protein
MAREEKTTDGQICTLYSQTFSCFWPSDRNVLVCLGRCVLVVLYNDYDLSKTNVPLQLLTVNINVCVTSDLKFFSNIITIRIIKNLTLYEKYEFLMQYINQSPCLKHVMFQHRMFCATIYIVIIN